MGAAHILHIGTSAVCKRGSIDSKAGTSAFEVSNSDEKRTFPDFRSPPNFSRLKS